MNKNHQFILDNWGKMKQADIDAHLNKAFGYTSLVVFRLRNRGYRDQLPLIGNGYPKQAIAGEE